MSLNHRQEHQLHRIEKRLLRSDPHLSAMLTVFGRLSAGQHMPTWEQVASRKDRLGQAATQIMQAIAILAAAVSVLIRAVATLIAIAFSVRSSRLPAPNPEHTRPGRETGDNQNPVG